MAKISDLPPLKPAQARAIAALMTERGARAAAEKAGVPERTLARWLTEDAFSAALRDATSAAVDSAVRRLSELADQAVSVLAEIMSNPDTTAGVRLQAASVALSKLIDLRAAAEFDARLAKLEDLARSE